MMAYSGNSAPIPPAGDAPPPPPAPYGAPRGNRDRSRSPGARRRSMSPRGGRRSPSPRGGRPHPQYYDSRGPAPYDGRGYEPPYERGYGGYDRGYEGRGGYPPRGSYGGYGGRYEEGYGGRYGGGGGGYRRRSPPPRRRYEVIKGNDEQRQTTSCLYVGNLPYSFREEDVQDLFDRYGRLRSVSVPFDRFTGRNKGFAFVAYEDRRDAEDAKNKYDGFLVEGRRLKIDWDIGLDKKDEIKSTTRPARGAPGDDFGRDRPRSPPPAPAAGRRSPQYSPYRRRSPSPFGARHP
ncbi:uncharacterized protein SPPG_03919 [Spizellomyces punctatus DAOM BR117]|uniref:RRM domain-containing protein n=1 Tax=Spizellomyces punctatus (strain DAOM BR117) TaxID=645134 RepID=A0A0L0HI68_SPIPD|nr:uncharacterized protein SPPG_03919 [Spizellomyces punctatus DAOM BR117]KND00812.1 hypothetical protein SPPG_03919 [Spizellomyces punctatus DAOM BR117]|eukprot:XP_016608851.1 hypothetical protein SPPG_03919 [Spizellomyces punctatus DAOM BR117]